jgi:hypothetical protein
MDLIDEAQSLLLHQFSKAPKLNALVRCLVKPLQEALDELEKLHHGHYIDQAYGQCLDVIGSLVDQPRLGMNDEDYRPWLKVAILRITNGGTAPGIFAIMNVLYKKKPPVTITEYPPQHVHFTLFEIPNIPMATFASIIRRSMPIGTDAQFIMAAPGPYCEHRLNIKANKPELPRFQLDVTSFSKSCFADFYEGELL